MVLRVKSQRLIEVLTPPAVPPRGLERQRLAYEKQGQGLTLREIGELLGVSHESARKYIRKYTTSRDGQIR